MEVGHCALTVRALGGTIGGCLGGNLDKLELAEHLNFKSGGKKLK